MIDGPVQLRVQPILGRPGQALVTLLVTLSVPKGPSRALPDRLAGVDPTVVPRDQLQRSVSPELGALTLIDDLDQLRVQPTGKVWPGSTNAVGACQCSQRCLTGSPRRLAEVDQTVVQREQLQRSVSPGAGDVER